MPLVERCCRLAIGAVLLLGSGTVGLAQAPRPRPSTSTSDLAAGGRIFAAQCALCHGTEGAGGSGPSLRRATLVHAPTDAALDRLLREGIPGTDMPFFELSLSDRMLKQVALYVRSLGRVPPMAVPGNASRGATIYASQGCETCHTVRGQGGVLGPDLSMVALSRGPASLRESLVEPGAQHPSEFRMVRISGAGAETVRGIVLNDDPFWIEVRDARGTVRTFAKSGDLHIERDPSGSLMPSYAALGEGALVDLIAYLSTLRATP